MNWNKTIFQELEDNGFEELETILCISMMKEMIAIRNIEDLTIFARK